MHHPQHPHPHKNRTLALIRKIVRSHLQRNYQGLLLKDSEVVKTLTIQLLKDSRAKEILQKVIDQNVSNLFASHKTQKCMQNIENCLMKKKIMELLSLVIKSEYRNIKSNIMEINIDQEESQEKITDTSTEHPLKDRTMLGSIIVECYAESKLYSSLAEKEVTEVQDDKKAELLDIVNEDERKTKDVETQFCITNTNQGEHFKND